MLIPCPYCGLRSHEEFTTLGEAGRVRPSGEDVQAFADHVYLRNNVAGCHRELWFHAAGCHARVAIGHHTGNAGFTQN
jgi:sarcosine oxidase subunit delta